jgi:hypothetical protein
MADDYIIKGRIVVDDYSAPGANSATRRLDAVERRARSVGQTIAGVWTKAFAVFGGATGIGVAMRGITQLHSSIDEAQIGLAGLMTAITGTPIAQTMGLARSQVALLRKDAAAGAGELSHYVNSMQMILTPAMQAGASLAQTRDLNRNLLAAGFALRGEEGLNLAPLDVVQAMNTGVISPRTMQILGAPLQAAGLSQEKFSGMSPAQRIEALNTALKSFAPAAEAMGKTWSAQMATLKDGVRDVVRQATRPLFERWTGHLTRANEWLAKNENRLGSIVQGWGAKLLDLWDHLITKAGTYAAIVGAAALAPHAGAIGSGVAGAAGAASSWASGFRWTPAALMTRSALRGSGGSLFAEFSGPVQAGPALAMRGLLGALGRLAGPLVIVTTAILAMKGAMTEYPAAFGFLRQAADVLLFSFATLGESFAMLTGKGSALNIAGGVLWGILGGLVLAVSGVVKILASLVTGLGVAFTVLGEGLKMLQAFMSGDRSAFSMAGDRMAKAMVDGQGQLSKIWLGDGSERGRTPQEILDAAAEAALNGKNAPNNNINLNGPITIQAKTELNEDPARVAFVVEDVIRKLAAYPKQGRRAPTLRSA